MARYKAVVAYDGALYKGFQRQATNVPTIQGEIERALNKIGWVEKSILAAGRTDTGVHAYGQVVAFNLDWNHALTDLKKALNANLPEDISVLEMTIASPDFHPRYDAITRHYRYRLFCASERDPIREKFAWRVWPEIQLDRLRDSSRHLVGTHDFAAFGSPPKPGGNTIRTIFEARWAQANDEFTFDLVADAFLYRMVRRIVQLVVEVAQGKYEPQVVKTSLLENTDLVQGLAPPQGLFLMAVEYR